MPSKSEDQQPSLTHGLQPPPTGAVTDRQPPVDNTDEPEIARGPFEQESSTETSRFEVLDVPVGSFSPESTTKNPEADPPLELDEDQPGASTRAARSKQSPSYFFIGAGLLVVVGAFAGQWILSPIPSSIITRIPSTQSEEMTPDPGPAPMSLVSAGEFMMGARQDDKMAAKDERTAHTVHLDAFSIDQYEVTTARYAKFFQETKRSAPKYWSEEVLTQHERKPVVGVDWNDAVAYCSWAGKRLPTEAEWEKAARGTDQRLYPWGNEEPSQQWANFDHCCDSNHYRDLTDVGSFEGGTSPYGVYDMAGNVWEWVADWSDGGSDAKSRERTPTGPSSGEKRVVRGGAWDSAPLYVRSSYRLRLSPTFRLDNIGFRCAQDVPK
ncbi:MAG: formylglycine-generating enzyme family protein [Nitrospira sp.]|nr:formylglycine-generating enzyme family protein [Nitrospira sp.]